MASNENSDQAARMDAMQEANENWDRQAAINAEDEERLNGVFCRLFTYFRYRFFQMLSGEEYELQLH
uniref:Uncharacterized protein n=1 Tax=Ditylenchus dipsaci TaxID=166011 RepID=A0A915DBP0_9BILA